MIDTLNMRCERSGMGINNPLSLCSHINVEKEGVIKTGERYAVGYIHNYRVYIDEHRLKLFGSMSKLIRGHNIGGLCRYELQNGIEALSDILHIDMSKATVSRIDIADSFHVEKSPAAYIEQMIGRDEAQRVSIGTNTLYFALGHRVLCFYDKVAEMRAKGEYVPVSLLRDGSEGMIRYEMRLTANIGQQIKHKGRITPGDIIKPDVWGRLADLWVSEYYSIQTDTTRQIAEATTASRAFDAIFVDLLRMAPTGYLQGVIGLTKKGAMTKKERYRLKKMIENTSLFAKLGTMVEYSRKQWLEY